MPGAKGLSLTSGTLVGLSCMQHYRFLTIPQFAKMTKVTYAYATRVLRKMEQRRIIGYFGYTSIPGQGKTPKVYFLTRRGYDWLLSESDGTEEEIGPFRDVHREFTWTPQMYHRIRLVDCFLALERAMLVRPKFSLPKTLLEYRRVRGTAERETTDYIAEPHISANHIVPDGAFILENHEKDRRGLFFVEMDMGTEQVRAQPLSQS